MSTDKRNRRIRRWAGGCLVLSLAAAGVPSALAAPQVPEPGKKGFPRVLIENLNGPRGVGFGPEGRLAFTQAGGAFSHLVRVGSERGRIVKLGAVPKQYIAPALDMNRDGDMFILTAGAEKMRPGAGALFRWSPGTGKVKVAHIPTYQRTDPDPWDLEKKPRTSNPFGVEGLAGGGAIVADAEGNDLLHVSATGKIETIARFKPRVVRVPKGLGPKFPPAGKKMRSEAVPTNVAIGPDGAYYVTELRGFPARPGTSAIWRIEAGSRNAVCNHARPNRGKCTRWYDGLTSLVDLDVAADGSVYALELSRKGWLRMELGKPGADIGRLVHIANKNAEPVELMAGQLKTPGGIDLFRGHLYVSHPLFGKGKITQVK